MTNRSNAPRSIFTRFQAKNAIHLEHLARAGKAEPYAEGELEPLIVFSPSAQGCGHVSAATIREGGELIAVASEFDYLDHPAGRMAFGGRAMRHRLGLHRRREPLPFAWFDDLPLPINSMAFHPTEPVIAIGAGLHDGGYNFNGDLVLWNWVENSTRRPFSALPQVVHLAFNSQGGLDLLLLPWNEDWGQGYDDDAIVVYPLTLAADQFGLGVGQAQLDPMAYVRLADASVDEPDPVKARKRVAEHLGADPFIPSRAVWDVGWFGEAVGWVTGERLLHLHDFVTGMTRQIDGEDREVGVAIVSAERPLVQTIRRWTDPDGAPELQTRLVALTDDGRREVTLGPYTFNITATTGGAILGRQVPRRGKDAHDFFRDDEGRVREPQIGAYDPYHHFLGVDGAPELYFLSGTRNAPDEWTQLCRLAPQGEGEPIWPLLSERDGALQATECCGTYVDDDFGGPGLIVAGLYQRRPATSRGFLYRRTLSGRELWRLPIAAAVTALAWLPDRGLVVATRLDGKLVVIEAATGEVRLEGRAAVQGVPTVIYAMSAHCDGRLAFGGIDGQVMVSTIDGLSASAGLVELG